MREREKKEEEILPITSHVNHKLILALHNATKRRRKKIRNNDMSKAIKLFKSVIV